MEKKKKKRLEGIWDVKHMFESSLIIFFIIGALATTAVYYVNSDEQETSPPPLVHNAVNYDSLDGCDLFSGKWVYDNNSYPLYQELQCPYIPGEFACEQHGRINSNYQQWRWQPHACNLPRFDAREVLERLRGKRVIFVGDSVNRNQWISMVCMLQTVIPIGLKKMQKVANASLFSFKAFVSGSTRLFYDLSVYTTITSLQQRYTYINTNIQEYDVSIDFYWAPLLVESNADHPAKHKRNERVVHVQSIENHAKNWVNADVLVFNSYLWWGTPTLKILYGSSEDAKESNIVSNHRGYRMVLKIWSNWLRTHINHTRTRSYFMSMTATHKRGADWGKEGNANCLNETEPIMKDGFWESGSDMKMMRILELSLNKLKAKGVNVQMMNITQLTQYRKDAHPSIHRLFYSALKAKQLSNPLNYADCTHWCLPGVPDIWNELLLTYILRGVK
ncbi:PC-Esterase [Cynara cardunculus var. scolymus]|uniref:PC-Esterase n=1 Tax=Cynara cardunculus var. scolymus TaxID=59895 RepID=A0A103YL89_CYNCS|nr:PC-Esterase [Cynara cardunculus var. scolymus]